MIDKDVVAGLNALVNLCERAKAVGLTPSKILGVNPVLGEVTPEQYAKVLAAVEAAEKK